LLRPKNLRFSSRTNLIKSRCTPFEKKMKNLFYIIILSLFLYSCCEKNNKTIYEHSGIKITRIDKCDKTIFYYQNDKNQNAGEIWAEYSGINDGFSGYLKFYDNGKVSILSGDGYFQSKELDSALFDYKRIYAYNRPKIDENICEIMLATRYERELNDKNKTGIKITYKTE